MTSTVIDTNVVLASQRSRHSTSPNVEIVARWTAGEFDWLHTPDFIEEYTEKLLELGVPNAMRTRLLALLQVGGIQVDSV